MAYTSNSFNYSDSANLDAFSRLRVGTPETLFDSKQINDKQPLFWDDQLISGSGGASTYNANQASTTLSTALNTAAVRARQTFRRFNYQPGKSTLFVMTGVFGLAEAGTYRKSGLFDENNGILFDQDPDGMGVTIRSSTSGTPEDNRIEQASWNIDTMDGNGPSKITLNFEETQIWFSDFEWLGVGRVRFGFFVDGRPYYVHEENHANNSLTVYMSTPNLPLRYEIENDGTGSAVGFTHICSTVISEGGFADTGFIFGASRGATSLVTLNDSDIYPLVAVQLKSTHLGSTVKLASFSASCSSTATYNYYILLNPTVTGTAFSFSGVTNSSCEVDTARTNATKVSGGTILLTGVTSQNNEGGIQQALNTDFALGSTIAGVSDIIVLAVQKISNQAETFYGAINWKDQQ